MKLFAVIYTTPVGIEIFSKAQEGGEIWKIPRAGVIPEPGVITGEVGQRRSLSGEPSDSREFQVV